MKKRHLHTFLSGLVIDLDAIVAIRFEYSPDFARYHAIADYQNRSEIINFFNEREDAIAYVDFVREMIDALSETS